MHIEKIEHDNYVETKLDAEEIKYLCEALYNAYHDNKNDPAFRKLYCELIIARDICLYGHLDDFGIANVVSCKDIKKISEQAKEIDQTRKEEA